MAAGPDSSDSNLKFTADASRPPGAGAATAEAADSQSAEINL